MQQCIKQLWFVCNNIDMSLLKRDFATSKHQPFRSVQISPVLFVLLVWLKQLLLAGDVMHCFRVSNCDSSTSVSIAATK
jgi:hypothetical protein